MQMSSSEEEAEDEMEVDGKDEADDAVDVDPEVRDVSCCTGINLISNSLLYASLQNQNQRLRLLLHPQLIHVSRSNLSYQLRRLALVQVPANLPVEEVPAGVSIPSRLHP